MMLAILSKQRLTSLPVRGAWVEIAYNERCKSASTSLPVRGAWVEMENAVEDNGRVLSLPVRGAWVEIRKRIGTTCGGSRRSPCGERGLKLPPP